MQRSLARATESQRHRRTFVLCASVSLWLVAAGAQAQGRGQAAPPPPTAKAIAPIDLTGYWTAVVTEDWHVRMLTPAKGDFGSGVTGTIENPGGEIGRAHVCTQSN